MADINRKYQLSMFDEKCKQKKLVTYLQPEPDIILSNKY